MIERRLAQQMFIRVCRDSGFKLGAIRSAIFAAAILKCDPLEIWLAMPSLDVMDLIAAGAHPALKD